MPDQTNNQQNSSDLSAYRTVYTESASQILSDIGLGNLIQPERGQLLAVIEKYIQQKLTNTLLSELDDDKIEAIDQILEEGGNQNDIIAYLIANIPEIEAKIGETIKESYEQLVDESRQLAAATLKQHNQTTMNEKNDDLSNDHSVSDDTSSSDIASTTPVNNAF